MNPENMGEQITLRHSSLWRKPYSYEKPVPESNSCHRQLNERIYSSIQSDKQVSLGPVAITSSPPSPQALEINPVSPKKDIQSTSNLCFQKKISNPTCKDLLPNLFAKMLTLSTVQLP